MLAASARCGKASAGERAGRFGCLVALLVLFSVGSAAAATRVHALVIGNNGAFRTSSPAAGALAPLRYADDDAAAFHELILEVADSSDLLTVMDAETQALYPKLASATRAPTLGTVRAVVAALKARIDEQKKRGDRVAVIVFFSGHGAVDYDGRPALALTDGGLDHGFLYQEVLEKLPADELHLLIDACHAEAIVRPRDSEADSVEVSAAQAQAFLVQNTLARFPHVGAIVAASTNTKAHEWDAIRHGIFTHELLSALRGAADVNRDRKLEYSEVYAFMSAANREVRDGRARLAIVARPPDIDRRTPLITLSDFPPGRAAWLSGIPGKYGIIEIDDGRGRRLVTLHGDSAFLADVLVPSGATLYVHAGANEARFSAGAGEVVAFERLKFVGVSTRERGPLEDAIRSGLFAAKYGRHYYDGIVDQTPGFLPVDFAETEEAPRFNQPAPMPIWGQPALVLAGGLSNGIADVATVTHGVSLGFWPGQGRGLVLSASGLVAYEGALSEWHLSASAGFIWPLGSGRLHGFGGGLLKGGFLIQAVEAGPDRQSGFVGVAPIAGFATRIASDVGLWSALELDALLLRRDARPVVSLAPAVWLGGSLQL
jgi:hypothetical protein